MIPPASAADYLRDPRIATCADGSAPAWLWSADGQRLLWTNAAAVQAAGAPAEQAAEMQALAPALVHGAPARIETLRSFGPGGSGLACACSRIMLPDYTAGILVVARDVIAPPVGGGPAEAPVQPATESAAEWPSSAAAAMSSSLSSSPAASLPSADAVPAPRHPLRFVWEISTSGIFTLDSDPFVALLGSRTAAALRRPWPEINARLALDPDDAVARAIATRETWSGLSLSWPTDAGGRLTTELSGVPVYDRQRAFAGYRGFGVCRDATATARTAYVPAPAPPTVDADGDGDAAPRPAQRQTSERPALTLVPPSPNVVPFRPAAAPDKPPAALSPGERNAFSELARQLTARLRAGDLAPDPADSAGPAGDAPQSADAATTQAPAWLARGSEARALLDRLPMGILIYRAETPLFANRALLDRAGYDSLDAFAAAGGLASLLVDSGRPRPDPSSPVRAMILTAAGGDAVPIDGRLYAVTWNGEPALALVLLERDNGLRQALSLADSDLRELKSLLEQTRQDVADARRLADSERRKAKQASAARAELLAKISHDIRTPLSSILGFAEAMLGERFGPIGNERYRGYLADIFRSGARVRSLVDDLLEFSRLDETGATDAASEGVGLNDVVRASVAQMQPDASRARVLLRTALAPDLPDIVVDRAAARQIVGNLLTSSIALAGAGGQVIVSTAVGRGGQIVLRVRDTGSGLSEDDLSAVLRPAAEPPAAEGTGLPLTRALAEANRATFAISSRANNGTLVEVAFPALGVRSA